jgi:hypothetical protein
MRQHGRQGGEEQGGQEGGVRAGGAQGPKEHDGRGDPEERQNSGAAERERAVVVSTPAEDAVALVVGIGAGVKAFAGEERAEGGENAGQRRVLVLIKIPAGGKILHAGGEVVGLVDGVVEDGVGGNDAGGSGEDQENGEKHGPAGLRVELQKTA